jgi:hypothetical protein
MSRAKNWTITINNHGEEDFIRLRKLFDDHGEASGARYLIFQQEVGEQGTPHIQGFISFKSQLRLAAVKKMVGDRAHLEVARGSPLKNREYCSKSKSAVEGTMEEFGELPGPERKRTDLDEFKEAVRGGLKRSEALELHSEVMAKYPRFAREYMDLYKAVDPVEEHALRPWQSHLEERLNTPPGDREIIFVVDKPGNAGKSWFAKRWCQQHPGTSQYMEPGKKADMAYNLSEETTHLFLNVTRQQVEHLQYSFLEACKDSLVFSPKYESGMKYLKKMHVVVMMNQEPDMAMLSEDRYYIVDVSNI